MPPLRTRLTALFMFASLAAALAGEGDKGGIFVISLHGEVNPSTVASFARRMAEAASREASVIVIDLKTDGGDLQAAKQAADAIHALGPAGEKNGVSIPTFVYVQRGFSAGTYFILASQDILVQKGAIWGGCAPWFSNDPTGQMVDPNLRKKIEAEILIDLSRYINSRPTRRNYPQAAVAAMVDPEVRLFEVKTDLDETFYWTGEELDKNRSSHYYNIVFDKEIDNDHQLLVLDTEMTQRLGFSQVEPFENLAAAIEHIRQEIPLKEAPLVTLEPTAVDDLIGILNLWYVRLFLLIIGVTAIYIELQVPGFGAPGITGIVFLGLYFGGSYMAGVADWVSLAFLGLGLVLLLLEIFVLPGFGVVGILGILSIVAGLYTAIAGSEIPDFTDPTSRQVALESLLTVVGGLGGAGVMALLLARLLPQSPWAKKLIHKTSLSKEQGFISGTPENAALVGKIGEAATVLRPVGKIKIDGKLLDAEAEGGILEAGTAVTVIRANAMSVLVRALPPAPGQGADKIANTKQVSAESPPEGSSNSALMRASHGD